MPWGWKAERARWVRASRPPRLRKALPAVGYASFVALEYEAGAGRDPASRAAWRT